jgi:hypothetical protein
MDEHFRSKVDQALVVVKQILDNNRNPVVASDVHHEYQDKFILATSLTNTTLAAVVNCLQAVGMTPEMFKTLSDLSSTKTITLRLKATEKCVFDRKEVKEVDSDGKVVVTGVLGTFTAKTVTKVTEYFYKLNAEYTLVAFGGVDAASGLTLWTRSSQVEVKTTSENLPYAAVSINPDVDISLAPLFKYFKSGVPSFTIDRVKKTCKTPRRNEEILSLLAFARMWTKYLFVYTQYCFFLTAYLLK